VELEVAIEELKIEFEFEETGGTQVKESRGGREATTRLQTERPLGYG